MTPYQRLLFATFAPLVVGFITIICLNGVFLLIGLLLAVLIASIGFFVSCPNCGKNPTQRRIADIPMEFSAPWISEHCPHCKKSLSRREDSAQSPTNNT